MARTGNTSSEIACKLECAEKTFTSKAFLLDETCCSNGLDI